MIHYTSMLHYELKRGSRRDMKKMIENFLTNGHDFLEDDNLQKFRFSLLNSLMLIAIFFTSLNIITSLLGFVDFSRPYLIALFIYTLASLSTLFLLRQNKKHYTWIVNFAIFSGLSLFYFALVTAPTDEFRLIWFFLALFVSFILMGKRYGLLIMLFILLSIFIINHFHDLEFSRLALFTFFNSFLIFTAFAYFFLAKIEKDAKEFTFLNNKLQEKVSQEVKQRQVQEKMLLQQCRLASMGEMIDSIAHQWRQPLMNINAILMNMDRIIEIHQDPKQPLEKKMDEVITLTTHMSQTIEDFRSLFKMDKEKHLFDIIDAASDVLSLLETSLKELTVHFEHPAQMKCHGHKNELIQVLMILLNNAIEALNTTKTESKAIYLTLKHSNSKDIMISVEDNAGGIEERFLEVIFDPYFTTKERTGGTGLGLYVAKIIIEQNMQGKLEVTNTPKGAKFTITLRRGNVDHIEEA